jgi:SAM-dependent methyltransferase
MSTELATYYERLGRWNRVGQAMGYGGGSASLTVHRALADPRANGRATFTRLHDVIVEHLPPMREPRVLDAGCGLGGTMIALADVLQATCTGLTLSSFQAAEANAAAARLGLERQVNAVVHSYDAPPEGPFDLIVAIESLAHSPDPARSVASLAGVLAPGGYLVVVDDMPEDAAHSSADLTTFKAGWQCPVLWSLEQYRRALSSTGLELTQEVDLTESVRVRSQLRIGLLTAVNRAAHVIPLAALRQVMDSHLGGLALERLIRNQEVRYRLLVARRPELQVS